MGIRRVACALAAIAAAATLIPATAARAQAPTARVRLERQTPWVTSASPMLEIDLAATSRGEAAVGDLSITIALGPAVRSRTEFERSLTQGPPFTVFARTFPIEGEISPGQPRTLQIRMDTSTLLSDDDSLVYPASVSLLSAGRPLATSFTPVLKLVREPVVPVGFTWWTELTAGPFFDPTGVVAVEGIQRAIGPGGRLRAAVDALGVIARSAVPFDVVVEPALLEQLSRMADGYRLTDGELVERGAGGAADAAAVLAGLKAAVAAPEIRVIGLPFAAPELPTMLRSGLGDDLVAQEAFGAERLLGTLGEDGTGPVAAAARNALDAASLGHLASRGATTVLATEDTVARPEQPNLYAPPAAAEVAAGAETVALVLPDPGTQGLFSSAELLDDPVRLAQAVLCELAVIWREQPVPVPPTVRGLAVRLPRELPAETWVPLVQRLGAAPFLRHLPADQLVGSLEPPPAPSELTPRPRSRFSATYVAALRREGAAIDAFASMLAGPSAAPERLRRNLFFAESTRYVGDEVGGRVWYDAIHRRLTSTFERIGPLPNQRFTFTSSEGTIQVALGDPGAMPLRVRVEFRSPWFRFPAGDGVDVTLDARGQIVPMDVEATASGRRAIRVLIRAPNGSIISEGNVLVSSTSANRIALIITGAAAAGLIALWSRRIWRRTRG